MANDPYYKKCCLAYMGTCLGRIEWHHSLIYGGRQIQKKFAILPACHFHHASVAHYNEDFVRVALNRATDQELEDISKVINYKRERERLNNIHGN